MATPEQLAFLSRMYDAAKVAGHIHPDAAACEAALETRWGTSTLYLKANNVFGSKTPMVPKYPSFEIPTREYLNGAWVTVTARFNNYPTAAESFEDRMATLRRLAPAYIHYANALEATTPEGFLGEVSRSWSTDPARGQHCIDILHAHQNVFMEVPAA